MYSIDLDFFNWYYIITKLLFYLVINYNFADGAKVKISAAHKRMQILPMRKQGKLTCQFEGDPVSITWEKVGLRTLPDRMVPRLNNLDILNVDMTDGGLYKCMAYDGFSKAQAEINVTVSGK